MTVRSAIIGLAFACVVGGTGLYIAEGRKLETPLKQVVIEQTGNGYTIDLCIKGTPCPVTNKDRRIARDAQGASAEVWAYLSGKGLPINWREP